MENQTLNNLKRDLKNVLSREEDLDNITVLKQEMENMIKSIDGRTNWIKRTKKFDMKLILTLPTDVINLIKEFIADDIEHVRIKIHFHMFCPPSLYTNEYLLNLIQLKCKKITKRKLHYLLKNANVGMNELWERIAFGKPAKSLTKSHYEYEINLAFKNYYLNYNLDENKSIQQHRQVDNSMLFAYKIFSFLMILNDKKT